ncbi:MAG: CoB--CoM heterodisulfide reductase iron-sulfur subunit B family protein [Desulfatibacillaceae bacterium]|nr:CoB--CoM heterodisulfide reductase iron-sulfur subunit B family protein [Desulfatibacillaceae bacterium]
MEYALFIGCNIPARVPQYESAARAVLEKLSVGIVDIADYACCGYPMKTADRKTWLLAAARNLALSEAGDMDTLVLCQCCFGSFKHAQHALANDAALADEINKELAPLGLEYKGKTQVVHLITALHDWVGANNIKKAVVKKFAGLDVAVHNGCHALRPSRITGFDDPLNPVLCNNLVSCTGASPVEWENRLECCGAPLMGYKDGLSASLMEKKLSGARNSGAKCIVSNCPWCQLQFDSVQARTAANNGKAAVPSILFPQLLGLAMGIDAQKLGLAANKLDISNLAQMLEE